MLPAITRARARKGEDVSVRVTLPREFGTADAEGEVFISATVRRGFLTEHKAQSAIASRSDGDDTDSKQITAQMASAIYDHAIKEWDSNIEGDNGVALPNDKEHFVMLLSLVEDSETRGGFPSFITALLQFTADIMRVGTYEGLSEQEKKV